MVSGIPAEEGDNALRLRRRGRVYPPAMAKSGLLIGEVAARSGVSRKTLRL